MKIQKLIFLGAIVMSSALHAVIVTDLPQNVKTKVYDRASGKLFLGMGTGAAEKSLMMFPRFDGVGTPASAGIATNSLLNNSIIEFLALSEQGCDTTSLLATVTMAATSFAQTRVIGLTNDGTTVAQSEDLTDATGNKTQGIVALAASPDHVFAAVRPNTGDYGTANSGIAVLKINTASAQLAAQGTQQFDPTAVALGITPPVTFDTTIPNENITLLFDTFLDRLYVGTKITAGVDGARSVAIGYIDDTTGALTIAPITPNGAVTGTGDTHIVCTSNAVTAEAYNLAVMHASTGPSYLIVNGEVNVANNYSNNIYALPLVDNPSAAGHGTLANRTSPLTNGKFTVAATTATDLVTNTSPEAVVGTGPLPIPTNKIPAEVVVVGDTVYASIDDPFGATSESGIFYSQALFDQNGKIISWTPWTKRAIPFNSFPDTTATQYPQTSFFDVDAVNGKIWAVNVIMQGNPAIPIPSNKLMTTAWDKGSDVGQPAPKTLAGALNKELSAGCYSILDLDQSTLGFDPATSCVARYALFGGVDKVVFALTTFASTGDPFVQQVTTDFSNPQFFRSFPLPAGSGAVTALEYSRRTSTFANENYFFAGTQNGLFVLADALEQGFTIDNTVNFLNATPFNDLQWYEIDGIEGSVIALKTTGQGTTGALYILTLEATTDATQPLISRLYSMPYDSNLSLMASNIRLIAQSRVNAAPSDLSKVNVILGMQTITVQIDPSYIEQLVIATNNGLYRSQAPEGGSPGIINANNQSTADWQPVDATDTALYTGLFGIDNALAQTTVWAPQVADEAGLKTYARGTMRQLSGKVTSAGYNFTPAQFNSSDPEAANATTLPQLTSFWTDGVRRFFVTKRAGDYYNRNRLMVFPFDHDEWCETPQYVLDPIFNDVCSCNCVKQIGATGILMVGTNSGVVALE